MQPNSEAFCVGLDIAQMANQKYFRPIYGQVSGYAILAFVRWELRAVPHAAQIRIAAPAISV
jgi:hypothetical protein